MTKKPESGFLPVQPNRGHSSPLSLHDVELDSSGFWGRWQHVNSQTTISHCLKWIKKSGWLHNFEAAIDGTLPGNRQGRVFTDADVYKLLEAMCWEYGRTEDETINETILEITGLISKTQEPDGYVNTSFGRASQEPRYSDLEWGHELYNYGHLLQAAVARIRSVGEDELVNIARRAADHVCHMFGEDGLINVCGHPEIETALIEFGRAIGEEKYIAQALLFLDRRGTGTLGEIEFGASYFQDDIPIREAKVFRGHAVRAVYLAAGAVDAAVETNDEDLLDSVKRQYEATIGRRTYVTGGMGSRHQDEAFGEDFELPNDRAYCETCAGVGLVMLNWRLLLETGEIGYADMIEHVLHNIVATSPSRDGSRFFYANTLHQRDPGTPPSDSSPTPRASASERAPWFEVSCCPNNLARLFASINGYVASSHDDTVYLHLLTQGKITSHLSSGLVGLRVVTNYPSSGKVRISVTDAGSSASLALRIPGWVKSATLAVNGDSQFVEPGYAHVKVKKGDEIELDMKLQPFFAWPHPMIDATRQTLAVKRGPLVYCAEFTENSGLSVDRIRINPLVAPYEKEGQVFVSGWLAEVDDTADLYDDTARTEKLGEQREFQLSPYFDWGENGPGTMRVWMPVSSHGEA